MINEPHEVVVVDHRRVAEDIRKLTNTAAVPFLAGIVIAGLMLLPDNLKRVIAQIKSKNLTLDNFEILCVLFATADSFRNDILDQTAQHAEQGVFPDGPGQEGWNEKEFEVCIGILGLTLNK